MHTDTLPAAPPSVSTVSDSHGWLLRSVYGIPSYWVQKVFSEVQGVLYAPTTAASDLSLVHTERVAASATCQDEACTDLAVKVSTLHKPALSRAGICLVYACIAC